MSGKSAAWRISSVLVINLSSTVEESRRLLDRLIRFGASAFRKSTVPRVMFLLTTIFEVPSFTMSRMLELKIKLLLNKNLLIPYLLGLRKIISMPTYL